MVVGIDLGGTAMKGAVVADDGALGEVETRPTGREDGPEAVVERLAGLPAHPAARRGGGRGGAAPGLRRQAGRRPSWSGLPASRPTWRPGARAPWASPCRASSTRRPAWRAPP